MAFSTTLTKEASMETSMRRVIHLDRYVRKEQALLTIETPSQDGIIHLRVDWNGDSGSLGTCQAQNLDHGWDDVGNLAPTSPINDVIFSKIGPSISNVTLHIQRDPTHGQAPFKAWARPIRWLQAPSPALSGLPETFSAVREEHYHYVGPAPAEQMSVIEGGIQTVRLALDLTHGDCELWVELQHPTDEDRWSTLDPIVGHGDRNGTPIIKTAVARTSDRSETSAS